MDSKEFQLYIGCKKKDSYSQNEVYQRHVKIFLAVCQRYLGNDDIVQDIVQESFIQIFRKIETFEWQGEKSFENWMKRIVTNAALNSYKKIKKQQNLTIDQVDDILDEIEEQIDIEGHTELKPDHIHEYGFSDDDLFNCIELLPENFKIVFNMFAIDKFSHKEIASKLGISVKTSTTRLFRARKLIQKDLMGRIKERELVYEK